MMEMAGTYKINASGDERPESGPVPSSIDMEERHPVSSVRKKHVRYPMSEKLKAVTMSESGMGSIAIGEQMGIDSSVIRGWVRKYRKYGIDGLKPASYGKSTPVNVMPEGKEKGQDGGAEDSKRGFIRHVDNAALMRSMIGRLLSYGIRRENIEVWENFSDYLKTIKDGETVVVNSLFDISNDISALITIINTLFNSNITVISLEDSGAAILPDGSESGTLLRILHNYVKVADIDTVPSGRRAATQTRDEPVNGPDNEPATKAETVDERFANAYGIWCSGGSMAYAARVSGCTYASFRYWVMKNHKQR